MIERKYKMYMESMRFKNSVATFHVLNAFKCRFGKILKQLTVLNCLTR